MEKNVSDEWMGLVNEWRAARPSGLPFNAFLMASQGGMSENAHSYTLKTLLNPKTVISKDGRRLGIENLRSFVGYLCAVAKSQGKSREFVEAKLSSIQIDEDVSVRVEVPTRYDEKEGRIDVLIEAGDCGWAIVIENKINGAPDMDRQLYRYVNGIVDYNDAAKQHCLANKVVAVVYINALNDNMDCPASANDLQSLAPLFLPIAGYKMNKTGAKSIVDGWLLSFVKESCNFPGGEFVVRQYCDVLEWYAKYEYCDRIFARIVDFKMERGCRGFANGTMIFEEDDISQEYPRFLARYILANVSVGGFSKAFINPRKVTEVVFSSLKVNLPSNDQGEERYIGYKIDVDCSNGLQGGISMRLFSEGNCSRNVCRKEIESSYGIIGDIVKDVGWVIGLVPPRKSSSGFCFDLSNNNKYVDYKTVSMKVRNLILCLSEKRDCLERRIRDNINLSCSSDD